MLRYQVRHTPAALRLARRFHASAMGQANVAVVLSGCGVFDGSEVTEAVATLVHLSGNAAEYQCFAPDVNQMHVIDHTKGEPMEESRNVLKESARIARGNIKALSELNSSDFDAIIFPGGFGAAKNLSTFAVDGPDMIVNGEVSSAIQSFADAKKPIGLCCIAPVVAAKVLPGVEVTVGSDQESDKWPYAGAAGGIDAMGGKHIVTKPSEAHVDQDNKVVTSAAYMYEGKPHEVFESVGVMVKGVLSLVNEQMQDANSHSSHPPQ